MLGIGLTLFGVMVRTLVWLTREIFRVSPDFRGVIAQVLFMLVMVEVVRLVIIYLEEHRVAVDFMVEPGIVATLREILLRGVTETAMQQILALTALFPGLERCRVSETCGLWSKRMQRHKSGDLVMRTKLLQFDELRRPGTFAIPKASNAKHAEENAGAGNLHLTEAELYQISLAFPLGPRPPRLPML